MVRGGRGCRRPSAARERVRKGYSTIDGYDSNADELSGDGIGEESDRAGERRVTDAMGAVRLSADERTHEEGTSFARPSTTNQRTPEERAVAIEPRRVAALEQSAAAKRRDALAAEEAAREASERTEKAAARVAEMEARAATDPKVAAESERLLRELTRREQEGSLSTEGRRRPDESVAPGAADQGNAVRRNGSISTRAFTRSVSDCPRGPNARNS